MKVDLPSLQDSSNWVVHPSRTKPVQQFRPVVYTCACLGCVNMSGYCLDTLEDILIESRPDKRCKTLR